MRPIVIMLHGRNAGPENILDLAPKLARPAFDFIAPPAPNRTWYPASFMAPFAENEPFLSNALARLRALVEEIERDVKVPRSQIVFLGFSQGACLATEFVIRNASRFGGLIAFSGGAIGPPGTTWNYPGTFDGTPMFFGCSDVDAHVPAERVRESTEVCARLGAQVTTRIYPGMGHLINDDEIEQGRKILDLLI